MRFILFSCFVLLQFVVSVGPQKTQHETKRRMLLIFGVPRTNFCVSSRVLFPRQIQIIRFYDFSPDDKSFRSWFSKIPQHINNDILGLQDPKQQFSILRFRGFVVSGQKVTRCLISMKILKRGLWGSRISDFLGSWHNYNVSTHCFPIPCIL